MIRTKMGNVLSALSLLLAVLGLLYSAWYPELKSASEIKIPNYSDDRKPILKQIRPTYYNKALPLFLSSLLISLIILPDFIRIIYNAIILFSDKGLKSLQYYDSVKTLLVTIFILLIFFGYHLLKLALSINEKIKECKV